MHRFSGTDSSPLGGSLQWWRVTTAVRVFALALALGNLLATSAFEQAGPLFASLVIIGMVCSALEWGRLDRATPLIPVGEALLVALILASAPAHPGLLVYLAVPPVVAAVRHGLVTTLNAALIGAVTMLGITALTDPDRVSRIEDAAPWLVTGLGAGLLASWQTRSARDLTARLAPYAAAHQLMAQLHGLARQGAVGLDAAVLAAELGTALRRSTGATSSTVVAFVTGPRRTILSSHGEAFELAAQVDLPEAQRRADVVVVPLRGAEELVGVVVLGGVGAHNEAALLAAEVVADEFAMRFGTAVLFDDVRHMSTTDERTRIAREMHDGVAQEMVALGYMVDEIESAKSESEIRVLAATLREEISRVVAELRHSIFDLRQHVDRDLASVLADYVQEVSRDTDLRVHLLLESTGPQLPSRTQSELLRIAQEAMSNVRRHAGAANVWLTFLCNGSHLRLEIADDGVGNTQPKERHWGLQTMQERALGIGAEFSVGPRVGGGTQIRIASRTTIETERNPARGDQSPAR